MANVDDSAFEISVERDSFRFSAAHLMAYENNNECESLHGHNYSVRVWVRAALAEDGYVADFRVIRAAVREHCERMNAKVLLPSSSPVIEIESMGRHTSARYRGRMYLFPADDVVLLPIPNISSELLAALLGQELQTAMAPLFGSRAWGLDVEVTESEGQAARCRVGNRQKGGCHPVAGDLCVTHPAASGPSHAGHMRRAIEAAEAGMVDGGSPFGALVVSTSGDVLAVGRNRTGDGAGAPTRHAEMVAIEEAFAQKGTDGLRGATLYSSCEPCIMCLSAAAYAGIGTVVFAASIDDARARGSGDPAVTCCWYNDLAGLGLEIVPHVNRDDAVVVFDRFMAKYGRI